MRKIMLFLLLLLPLTLTACNNENVSLPVVNEPDKITSSDKTPVISLIGEENIYLFLREEYVELGATIVDSSEESPEIVIRNYHINTRLEDTYEITYNYIDPDGDIAETVTRYLHVLKEPEIHFVKEYEGVSSFGVMMFLNDDISKFLDLHVKVFSGDTLIATIPITSTEEVVSIDNLTINIDYTIKAYASYTMPNDSLYEVTSEVFSGGSLKRLDDSLETYFEDQLVYHAIKEMTYIPYSSQYKNQCNETLKILDRIDSKFIIDLYTEDDLKIMFTTGFVTDIEDYYHLKGKRSEFYGFRYSYALGICCTPVVVRIQEKANETLLHEIGHGVDRLMGWISSEDEWISIYEAEKELMFPDDDDIYYKSYKREYFAEVFSYYYYSDEQKQLIQDNAPLTYAFIDGLLDKYNDLLNE